VIGPVGRRVFIEVSVVRLNAEVIEA